MSRQRTPPPPAAAAANRARIRLWPTRLGMKALLFHAVLLTTFFAIPYSNLFFLGITFLSVVAACNVIWAYGNLRGVSACVPALAPCAAGSPVTVSIAVSCRSRRLRCGIAGRLEVADTHGRTLPVDIAADAAVLVVELPALARGVYRLGCAQVESTHPYGLVRAALSADAPTELIVHPAPVSLSAERRRSRRALVTALLPHARCSGDTGTSSLRDWRTGDDPRRVHWRATARRGELVVRETDDDDGSGNEVVLDRRCAPDELEAALSTVATLALAASERKDTLTLHTQGSSGTYGSGRAPTHELLRLLAVLQPLPIDDVAPPTAPTTALRLPHGGRG